MKSVYKTLTLVALEPASQSFVEATAESPSPDASPRLSGCELARSWRRRTGSHALLVRLPVTPAMRSGALTNPEARRGTVTFDQWLEAT